DTWDYYQNGRLIRRERDSDGDGIIDQWWQFDPNNPKCATVSSDRNADGKPDPDSVVDLCGESYGAPPKAPPGATPSASASAAPSAPPPAMRPETLRTAGSASPSASPAPPAPSATKPDPKK